MSDESGLVEENQTRELHEAGDPLHFGTSNACMLQTTRDTRGMVIESCRLLEQFSNITWSLLKVIHYFTFDSLSLWYLIINLFSLFTGGMGFRIKTTYDLH